MNEFQVYTILPTELSCGCLQWLLKPPTRMEFQWQFVEKWLPIHARKERFSPNSYDSYRSNLDRHILPYFGDRVMSSITAEDIDDFLDALSRKPCRGPKSYGKRPEDIPTLSSSTVKKCFTILTSGFETAKKWHYISEIPKVTAPTEKTVKRRAWDARRVYEVLDSIKEDELRHLAVHLAFFSCRMEQSSK